MEKTLFVRHIVACVGLTDARYGGLSVAEHVLTRTGNSPLKFAGELIAESRQELMERTTAKPGKAPKRWYELALYRTASDQYVVAIAYRAEWQGEYNHYEAVGVSDIQSAVQVFRNYDPIVHVVGFPPREAYAARQARLLTDLRKRYTAQVTELLNRDEFAEVIS